MPNLKIVTSSLKSEYEDYKLVQRKYSESRKARDDKFEALINEFKEKKLSGEQDIEEFLEKICDFYVKYKKSASFRSRPDLINSIEQALYNIFEIDHSQPTSNRGITYFDPKPWTDASRKTLDNKIEEFKNYMKKSYSQGMGQDISMRTF